MMSCEYEGVYRDLNYNENGSVDMMNCGYEWTADMMSCG